jgi:hypothetical protein
MQFVAPELNNYYNAAGTTKRFTVYDNTAIYYTNSYVSQFIAAVFPPKSRWATFRPSTQMIWKFLKKIGQSTNNTESWEFAKDVLSRACEKLSKRIFDVIFDSNFDEIMPSLVKSFMISCGAANVQFDRYRGHGVSFFLAPLGSYAYDMDAFGNTYGIFYANDMTLANARLQWDLENVPKTINENNQIHIIECTVRIDDKWCYVVLMNPGGAQSSSGVAMVTKPRYMDFCPWAMMRSPLVPAELWARGILINCLQDMERVNHERYLDILNKELASFTSFMYKDDGSINPNTFRMSPGSLIRVKSTGGANGPSLVPIQMPYNLAAHQVSREESQSDLMRDFLFDPFLGKDINTYQSAREWSDRQRFNQVRLGTNFGCVERMAKDVMLAVLQLMMGIEGIAELPDELAIFGDIHSMYNLGIVLESPISKIYNAQEVESLIAVTQLTASLSPEALGMTIKVIDIPRWLGGKMGVSEELFRTKQEIADMQQEAVDMVRESNPANMGKTALSRGI